MKHYYFPGWHQPSTLADLMINLERWRELDATRQAQIEAARAATMRDSIAESEALQFEALQEVQAKGVQLHRWPPEMLAAFEAAWQEVAAGRRLRTQTSSAPGTCSRAFRAEYKIWKHLGYLD